MVMHGFGIGMVRGSIFARTKLNFLFAKFIFGMKLKGQKNPSCVRETKEVEKRSVKQPLNYNYA